MALKSQASLVLIDKWLRHIIQQKQLVGCQVSIRRSGNLIFDKAYGYADLSRRELYTTEHVGRIASQSKMFASALVFCLQKSRDLSLNDPISWYLPSSFTKSEPLLKKVTIEHLLTNRSGLIRDSYKSNYWGGDDFIDDEALLSEIQQTKLIAKPGTVTKYSNLGFALLGTILEKASGRTFGQLVSDVILHCLDEDKITSDFNSRFRKARGYSWNKHSPVLMTKSSMALNAAAGLMANTRSTTDFLYKFLNTNRFLGPAERKLLLKKAWPVENSKSDRYGYGLIHSKIGSDLYVGHSGGFRGFTSHCWHVPKSDLTFGLITNMGVAKTFNIVRSMNEIISLTSAHFSSSNEPIASELMLGNFNPTIYLVGKKRALGFPVYSWWLTEDVMLFKKKGDSYISTSIDGYKSWNEPLKFKIKNKNILAVKLGGYESYPLEK
jgi:D-alanyl-D-alanine carboxypeptidase